MTLSNSRLCFSVIAMGLLIFVAACEVSISSEQIKRGEILCKSHGGLKKLVYHDVITAPSTFKHFECKDGTRVF